MPRCGCARGASGWQALTPHARARFLYAMARAVQRHSRRLAVLETIDNGKPIRESRDIDIPLVARHFYHHAGWAQLLEPNSPVHRLRRGGADHSVEFSVAHAGVEDRAGAGDRQYGCAEAGGIHSAYGAGFCRNLPGDQLAGRRREYCDRRRSTGEALVKHPDVDKIAFTGSTEVGRAIRKATAEPQETFSGTRRQIAICHF